MSCTDYEDECRPLLPEGWDIVVRQVAYSDEYDVQLYNHRERMFQVSRYSQNGIDTVLKKRVIDFTAYWTSPLMQALR
jgi:predicted RecB family nuclease